MISSSVQVIIIHGYLMLLTHQGWNKSQGYGFLSQYRILLLILKFNQSFPASGRDNCTLFLELDVTVKYNMLSILRFH